VVSPKSIAILQSNYIPWKGYFDVMAAVDEFVIYDEAQYTKRDWRNRNRIISNGDARWLTIPVRTAGHFRDPIASIEIADPTWSRRHWSLLHASYGRSRYFEWLAPQLESLYRRAAALSRLTDVNELFLRHLAGVLGLPTRLMRSDAVPRAAPDATGRLIEICRAREAEVYVTGPTARAYIEAGVYKNKHAAEKAMEKFDKCGKR